MPLTLGLTGMDPATESALQTAFKVANAQLGGHWTLVQEQQADFVVVDMDSMYGPMSWLRLHASGKAVVALTAAQRTQADYLLTHPFSADSLVRLLGEIATHSGQSLPTPAPAPVAPATVQIPQQPRTDPTAALPDVVVELLQTDLARAKAAVAQQAATAAIPATRAPVAAAPIAAPAAPAVPATPPPAAASAPAFPVAPAVVAPATAAVSVSPSVPTITVSGDGMLDWLVPGRLRGLLRVGSGNERILIDADHRKYHGPAALKPLSGLFDRGFAPAEFELLPAAQWDSAAVQLGAPMPLTRLVWFGNLLAGRGRLAPGHDPHRRYRMTKWPQTEREYPKHFRIATVMMKAPATLAEIAEASGVTESEVADFINANLATGFAEPEGDPTPAEPAKSGGLFGRLRGR
ncbi:hypothetical protein [Lysobacter sp. CA199]|uniref:hypothetical protein n=1 Tax=Lysobacter sp. CA199 TaxID=3455608 RepID=UPI003F8D2F90